MSKDSCEAGGKLCEWRVLNCYKICNTLWTINPVWIILLGMMKKHLILFTCLLALACLTGCGKEPESADMVKEVQNLPDATITIPSVLVGSEADELLPVEPDASAGTGSSTGETADSEEDSSSDENTSSGESTDSSGNGTDQSPTVTYQIDGDTRTELVNNIAKELQESIDTVLADKYYYPNISEIKVNEDATEFTICLTCDKPNLYESTLMLSFYTIGNKYQIYNGVPAEEAVTTVIYVNSETGAELARTDSKSMD